MAPLPNEFELIRRYFAPLSAGAAGAFGLTDDAAVLKVPAGHELVATSDSLVAGTHFLAADPLDQVARKALRVNLSDLAAMGAAPLVYLLNVSLPPDTEEDYVAALAAGFRADQEDFGIVLAGGDTVATPGPLTLTVTALGLVPTGQALTRHGARVGDLVCVSGSLGDATLGLLALTGRLDMEAGAPRDTLVARYRLPQPRLALGIALRGTASACIDVSDGCVADLEHVCNASSVAATIDATALPLSGAAEQALARDPALLEAVVTGGDDYELLFTLPAGSGDGPDARLAATRPPVTVIGRIEAGEGVTVLGPGGAPMALSGTGFRHF